MRRLFAKHGARWLLALVLTSIAAIEVMGGLPTMLTDRIDLFFYDMRMRIVSVDTDPRIVIVDIDEKSINEVGRWPWSRDVVAELISKMADRYEAQTIAFDVLFAEPDNSSGYATLAALAQRQLKSVPEFNQQLQLLKPSLDFDARMVAAIQGRPVVMGYTLSNQKDAVTKGQLPPAVFTKAELEGRNIDVTRWRAYAANLPQLQNAAQSGGFFNPVFDSDGLIRAVPLLAQVGDGFYESLALAAARTALGAVRLKPIFLPYNPMMSEQGQRNYGALEAIALDTKPRTTRIPVERELTTLVAYRGSGGVDGGAFRYISAVDILKERIPKNDLAGRILLVGTTVPGLYDLRATPVSPNYPGVEIHANIIASILDGDFKQRPEFAPGFNLIQVVLVGLLLGLLLPRLSPLGAIGLSLLAAIVIGGSNFWLYHSAGLVLPMATALLLIFALFICNLGWGYLFEYRNRRAIVNLFGEYVAPELVAEMAANPDSYSMEGESRELTVMFSDVRGFTTISESLQPNELREFINAYLTAMSEDIRGNRGTLDKYIGDAVMAFWGAPIAFSDHAARAVATALKMQQTVIALNEDFAKHNWPALKIGIGLNTGTMRVGDMGSKIRRAYTVMGDAVNLSSRLESITKVYGVGILVGQTTRYAATQFAYRELDRVRVKGKNEPVPIFEPVGLDSELSASQREQLTQWHSALELVRSQQWDAAEQVLQALQKMAAHGVYALYLERIAYFRAHPLPPDWDGVTTFETK